MKYLKLYSIFEDEITDKIKQDASDKAARALERGREKAMGIKADAAEKASREIEKSRQNAQMIKDAANKKIENYNKKNG